MTEKIRAVFLLSKYSKHTDGVLLFINPLPKPFVPPCSFNVAFMQFFLPVQPILTRFMQFMQFFPIIILHLNLFFKLHMQIYKKIFLLNIYKLILKNLHNLHKSRNYAIYSLKKLHRNYITYINGLGTGKKLHENNLKKQSFPFFFYPPKFFIYYCVKFFKPEAQKNSQQ